MNARKVLNGVLISVIVLAAMLLLSGRAAAPVQAQGTFITVTSAADDGTPNPANCPHATDCRLRDAIAAAASGDTIVFGTLFDTPQTITLVGSELGIGKDLTIDGFTAATAPTISGNNTVRVFSISSAVTLNKLKIVNGKATGDCPGFSSGYPCGGGIYNASRLTVTNSTLSNNSAAVGGSIWNYGGPLTLTNSTFVGNSASLSGGGIYNAFGTLRVTNSTFSSNSATYYGGAIIGTTTVTNSTFSGNSAGSGGGVIQLGSGTATFQNTIFANSTSGGNCSGNSITDGGGNLRWPNTDTSCVGTFGDPKLGVLADNGGDTQTFPLLSGSSAIDTGDDATCAATDQRGVARPQGTHCDIGAYEVQSSLHTLLVAKTGNGTGAVSSNPAGIDCGTDCAEDYALGTTVTLTATADSGFTFTRWSGDATGSVNPVTVTMTANKAVTATFTLATTTSVTSSPNPSLYEQAVTFTATVTSTLGTPSGGTVAFQTNGVTIAGCEARALAGGQATCVTAALTATVQPITATYSGDATYNASVSAALFQGVYARPAVDTGGLHTCGLKAGGTLACWGRNGDGETNVPSPNTNWVQVSAGYWHTCGLKADGTLACWGYNYDGQTNVPGPNTNWVQVSAGSEHTCGLKANGTLMCWGWNYSGQTTVPGPNTNWVQVSAGLYYTCGLKADGTLACWGHNGNGKSNVPGPNTNWVQVSAGGEHTCGLKADGALACWGYNSDGQTTVPSPNTNWVQVSAGYLHTCGLKADGTLACWGYNAYGQTTVPSPNTNWVQVSAGYWHTCGLKADGTLACWGHNVVGEAPVISLTPATLPNATAGAAYTRAITATGTAGATPPYILAVVAGATPPGLTLNANGVWSGAPTALGVFTFTVQARDANDIAATRDYTLTVKADTTTTLTSSPNPSLYGQAVTFTATVTSTVGTPTGMVTFFDNATNLGSGALNASGVATVTTASLTIDTHSPITATYGGSADYNGSTSSTYSHTVTFTIETVTYTPIIAGQWYTFGIGCGGVYFTGTNGINAITLTARYGYPGRLGGGLPRRYDIELQGGDAYEAQVQLCYSHDDLDAAGMSASEGELHAYHYIAGNWVPYSAVDTVNNTVTAGPITTLLEGVWGLGISTNEPNAVTVQDLSASAHGESNGLVSFAALFALLGLGLGAARFTRRGKVKAQP